MTPRIMFCTALLIICTVATGCSRSSGAGGRPVDRGNEYFARKDFNRAILEYKNAIQATPSNPEPHYRMALALLETGDPRSAVMFLRKTLSLNSEHKAAQKLLAEMMAFSHDPKWVRRANQQIQDLMTQSGESGPDSLRLLAITEWRLGRVENAEKHLREALAKAPQDLQSVIALASVKLGKGETAAAETLVKETVERTGSSTAALMVLGRFYVVVNRLPEAEQQFRIVCEREPRNVDALLDLARVQTEIQQFGAAETAFRRVAAADPKRAAVLVPVFLYQTGRPQQAIDELKKLLDGDPANRTFRSVLVSAQVSQNRTDEAEQLLAAALAKNGRDLEARLQRARILLMRKRYVEAQADLGQVLHFEPNSAEAHYLLSRVHGARGEIQLQTQELMAALQADKDLVEARVDLSKRLIASKDARGGLQIIDTTPPHQARLMPVVVQRNWALIAVNNGAEARRNVEQAMRFNRTPELLLQDAVLKITERNLAGGRQSLEEALKLRPDDVRAIQAMAATYAMENNGAKALATVREYASRQPRSAAVQALAGRWLFDAGDHSGARAAYFIVKELEPDPVPALLMLASIDTAERKLDAARQKLTEAAALPGSNATVYLQLGNLEAAVQNRDAALKNYRKAVELDHLNVWALNNLAFLLAEHAGAADEALQYAQRAAEALPNDDTIQDTLGWVYFRKGIYGMAVKHLESAALKGSNPSSRYHLAAAYAKAGRRAEAEKTYQAALRAAPGMQEAAIVRDALNSR